MPVMVGAALAGSLATSVAVSTGFVMAGTLASYAIGAAVSFATSQVLGAVFSDSSGSDSSAQSAAPQFEQELRDNLVTVRQPITHWQYIYGRARVGGAMTFAECSPDNRELWMVITLAGHVSEEIESVWFNEEEVPFNAAGQATGKYAGYVGIFTSLGDESGQPFPYLVSLSAGKWTDAHRQTGRTKIFVQLIFNPDLFPTGIPNITAVVKGKKVYDPRSGLTAYSDNASLCINDFLCDPIWLGCTYASEIDETQLIAAANIDDEAVSLAAGGTEARYTLNGSFSVNTDSRTVLGRMLTANAGRVHYIGGLFRILPAAYVSPTITFTEDSLRGVPQIEPRLSASDACNGVKGVYVSEDNLWQPSDFPPVTNATYLAEDGGERSWRELDLPFTKSAATAQRIAKIELERARQQISVVWPGKLTCYRAQPGDVQLFTFAMLGWSAKAFEVVGGGLTLEADSDGQPTLGSDLALRETASSVFDWSSGEETQVDPAPDTNLPDPWTVGVPGTPTVTEEIYETTGSAGVKSKAAVEWEASADQQVSFYELEYKAAADSAYTRISPISSQSQELFDLAPGSYNFRVRAVNGVGVHSDYSGVTTKELLGLTEAPGNVSGFYVTVHEGRARCHVTKTTDLDVAIGGRLWIRWSTLASGAAWNDGTLIKAEGYPGDSIVVEGPLYPGTYMAKFEDSTGNFSTTEASFVVTETLLDSYSTPGSVTFHPTFDGTKVSVATIDSALQLTGSTLWDSIPGNMDSWDKLDSLGGIASSGSCTFTSKLDLTSVLTVRLVPTVKTLAFDTGDLWDSRTTPMDDWGLIDGSVIEDAEIQPQVRVTSDDPASGGATWGPWHNLEVSDYTARGFEFRTLHTSGNVTHNRKLLEFSVAAKQPS
jgi:hypothetical protein